MLGILLVVPTIMVMVLYRNVSRNYDTLKKDYNDLEWDLSAEKRQHNYTKRHLDRLENKLSENIQVGHTFHVPNLINKFVNDYCNTTQRIVSVDIDNKTFNTVDVVSGKQWLNRFEVVEHFIWIKENDTTLKHKFI